MVEYRGSQGEAMMSVVNSQTKVAANYIAQGSFQKGNAALRISMVKQGDTWMIGGFNIGAPGLMQKLVGPRS
jgi:hypothetical protein